MAVKRTIRRYRLGGVNRSADLDAENSGALISQNLLPCPTGGLRGREGFKVNAQIAAQYTTGAGAIGMTEAHLPDLQVSATARGRQDEIIIGAITSTGDSDGGLYRAKKFVITLTNASLTTDYVIKVIIVSGTWQFRVELTDETVVTTLNLGTPKSSVRDFATLAANLNSAVSDLTLTYPSDFQTSRSASYLTPVQFTAPINSTVKFDFITGSASPYISEGPTTSLGVLEHGCKLARYGPSRRFHGVQFQNRLWFRDIWRLRKYDGKNAWCAGVKAPAVPTLTPASSGGSIPDGGYAYLITYSVKDAQNYEVESDGTETATGTVTGGGGSGSIAISNIAAKSGWIPDDAGMAGLATNGWGAVCSSTMGAAGTSITCATYLRLDIGDPVYLYDRQTSQYVERYVTNVSGTTVTLNLAVKMTSGDAMSPVRVNIYRTKIGPSTRFYFVAAVPVNISASTQSYTDTLADTSLGFAYVTPDVEHAPPPTQLSTVVPDMEDDSGSYPLELYRNCLVMGGLWGDKGACAFSDINAPEHWPEANTFRPGEGTEEITGLKASQDFLFIFTNKSTYQATGDLATEEFRVVPLGGGIGCASHDSIADCGGVIYWCSSSGVYRSSGGAPEKISMPIEDLFISAKSLDKTNSLDRRRYERSVGCYVPDRHQYWLFVPAMKPAPTVSYPWATDGIYGWLFNGGSTGTTCYVFDIATSQWYFLEQLDFSLGLRVFDGQMVGLSVGEVSFSGATRLVQLVQKIQRDDEYASVDDSLSGWSSGPVGILVDYASRYDSLGKPGVLKKALRMRIEALNAANPPAWRFSAFGYKDYVEIGLSSNYYTYKTPLSADSSAPVLKWRLLPGKLLSFAFRIFGSATIYERATLTGVEVEFAESYRDGFKEPNG